MSACLLLVFARNKDYVYFTPYMRGLLGVSERHRGPINSVLSPLSLLPFQREIWCPRGVFLIDGRIGENTRRQA